MAVTVSAPAKINLYLGVYPERDERGYHRVDSVMCCVDLADSVSIEPAESLQVTVNPPVDVPAEQNSVYKAVRALEAALGREANVAVHVEKRIPARSGLGGASSDAAAAIVGLCDAWGVDPRDPAVVEAARSVGADVPFFLYGNPAYLAGAGDVLAESFPPFGDVPLVLVRPGGWGITAKEAYERFDELAPTAPCIDPVLSALRGVMPSAVLSFAANNLGSVAADIVPEIKDVLAWMDARPGLRHACVTGSGSCSFAEAETPRDADLAVREALERGWWACATHTLGHGPRVTSR